ncbi:MAG: TonB-dependent receptor [Dinghuibacter sp.]|nr:TonB-dependent receptor [Dinghuibacter sp.]
MRKLATSAILLLGIALYTFKVTAQKNGAVVRVLVTDSINNQPLQYVSVKLGCGGDLPLAGGITSVKGECVLYLNKPVTCTPTQLTISRTGYATRMVPFTLPATNTSEGMPITLYLAPVVIRQEGVTVTASIVTKEVDKTTFRIRQTDYPAGTKIAEMINRVPALSSAGSSVTIKGNIKAEIYIDGKMVNAEILKTLPVETVKSIEVIENPNASVSGETNGGIVNIILRKDVQLSGGSISASTGLYRPLAIGSANFMYSNKKIFWMISVSGQTSIQKRVSEMTRDARFQEIQFNQHTETRGRMMYYNANSEFFWKLDSTRQISAILYTNLMGAKSNSTGLVSILQNRLPADEISSTNRYHFTNRYFSGVFEYKKQVNKEIQYILTGGYQHIPKLMDIENSEKSRSLPIISGNRQTDTARANSYSVQAVVSRKNKTKKVYDWETGILAKLERSNDRFSQFELQPDNNYSISSSNTNSFVFEKTVAAAYTQLKFMNKRKFQFSTGLRAEYFRLLLEYPASGNNLKRDFVNVFPTLGVYKALKNDYNLQMNYARRIRRPDVTILSQFYYGTNRALLNTGNADLLPELANKLSVSLSRFRNGRYIDATVYGSWKSKPIFEKTLRSTADSSIVRTIDNFRRYISAGGSFTFLLPVKKRLTINGTIYAEAFHLSDDQPLDQLQSGIIAGGNLNVNLALKNKININGYISYSNYTYEYQQLARNFPLSSISVQKSFFKDKLSVSLSWMDVLTTGFNRKREYNDGFISQVTHEIGRNNNISLGVVYNFGKKLRNNNKQKALLPDEIKERRNAD